MGDEQSKPKGNSGSAQKQVNHDKCEKAAAGGSNPQDTCAICLHCPYLILMPCCGNVNSSTRFCFGCMETYCDGGVANCPKCRKAVQVKDGKIELVPEHRGRCRLCC